MSQQIANVNLSGASLGPPATTGKVTWEKLLTPPTLAQQMQPAQASAATLMIQNESGAQLLFTFPDTGRTVSWPAGKWAPLTVRANETSFTYTVTGIASNPLFNSLLVDFYWPGEPVDSAGTLGNSPIGGTVPLSVAQVINDGNPTITNVVESTQQGATGGSNIVVANNGKMLAQEWTGSVFNTLFLTIPNALTGNSCISIGKGGNFLASVSCNLRVTGSSTLDNGSITTDGSGNTVANTFKANAGSPGFTAAIAATSVDQNACLDIQDATSGAIEWQVGKQSHANGDTFRVIDATHGVEGIALLPNNGGSRLAGPLTQLAGIATAGRGAPLEKAVVVNTAVTSSAAATVATFTSPASNAMIRLNVIFSIGAGNTNSGSITLVANYTDPFSGAAASNSFLLYTTPPAQLVASTLGKGGPQYITVPMFFQASVSTTVSVVYTNGAAGTISDKVTVIAEVLG